MAKLLSDDDVFGASSPSGLLSDDEVFGSPNKTNPKGDALSDAVTALHVGTTVDVPQQLVGINAMLRELSPLGIITGAATPGAVKGAVQNVEDLARAKLEQNKQEISSDYSPAAQEENKKNYFGDDATWKNLSSDGLTGVPGKAVDLIRRGKFLGDAWTSPRKIVNSALESLPSTILTMGPTAKLASASAKAAGDAALSKALESGIDHAAAVDLAQQAATAAAEKTAMIVGGSAEGLQGAGSQYEQTFGEVMAIPLDKVKNHPEFKHALSEVPPDVPADQRDKEAQRILATKAATVAGSVAFGFDSVFGALGDRFIGSSVSGKAGGRGRAAMVGVANEAPTEFIQSAGEQLGTNLGVNMYADEGRSLGHDVGEQAVGGGLSGGLMGGVMGGAFHSSPRNAGNDNAATQPPGPGVIPAASAEEVLGIPAAHADDENALYQPKSLTALDRVHEIDTLLQGASQSDAEALRAERDSITKTWPKAEPGRPTTFTTEAGSRVDAQYALMDAGDLVTSHDENLRQNPGYPQELQPRERDRAASEMQVSGIVQRLDPARLGESADAANGSPIVGADGLVESGNARTIALKRIYQANGLKAQDYKAFIKNNAERFGLDPAQVDSMKNPVLVRVRNTPVDRAEFARQANASTVAQMSPSEQAKSDAARIDDMADLLPDDNGDFANAGSRGFIRRFMSRLPSTEQAGMIDASGGLSQTGYARIRNAVLAKAYGDSQVLLRMVESMDDSLRNISKALMRVAPQVAKARQSIDEGLLHDADLTPDLLDAVSELARLKESGRSVSDELAQVGMFGDKHTAEARELLQFLDENIRRPRQIAEFIQRYFEGLAAAGNPNQGSLLGETSAPAKGDLINAAKRTNENVAREEEGLGNRAERDRQEDGKQSKNEGGRPQGTEGNARTENEWVNFPPETGTLGIPRAQMPQIKGDARGALVQFLKARGIENETEEVPADTLKPTQAEFSVKKTEGWKDVKDGGDRSVLASSDGYILDGHHQWVAALATHDPIKVIRFDAPMKKLLGEVNEFPSAKRSVGAGSNTGEIQARNDFDVALADLGAVLRNRIGVAAMIKEEDYPDLLPTLTKLFSAAFRLVGYDMKKAGAYVRAELKKNETLKKIANFIKRETMDKAAQAALEIKDDTPPVQDDLFANAREAKPGEQMDLFSAMATAAPSVFKPKEAMIDGRPYDPKRDNYKPPATDTFIPAETLAKARDQISRLLKESEPVLVSDVDRARAENTLRPIIKKAEENKAEFDQKIIDIAKKSGALGQMLTSVKSIESATRKLVNEVSFDTSRMYDMLRSTIVVGSYSDAQVVLDTIRKQFDVIPGRIKNMTDAIIDGKPGKFTPSGYGQVLINVKIPGDVIAEIQINVPEMLAVKLAEGHALYEIERSEQDGSQAKADAVASQNEIYPLAAAAAVARKDSSLERLDPKESGRSLAEVSERIPVSSSSLNTLPSGNLTNSVASPLVPNSQPAGNLSGTFISATSKDSIAEGKNPTYTNDNGNIDGVANEQRIQSGNVGAQGQESGAVQQPAGKRNAESVRSGSLGRDSIGSGDQADGNSQAPGIDGKNATHGESGNPEHGGRPVARRGVRRDVGIPAGRDIPVKTGRNYRFGEADLNYDGSWLVKARQNVEALELLRQLDKEGRQANKDEQAILAKFIGWGSSEIANSIFGDKLNKQLEALGQYEKAIDAMDRLGRGYLTRSDPAFYQAFSVINSKESGLNYYSIPQITKEQLDKAKPDTSIRKWADLRDRIKAVLSPDEWKEASRSTQYAHYTSKQVVNSMWSAMERMGFKGGAIIEPGAGIGVFPGLMPSAVANNSIYTGIEFDSVTGGILKQLFPDERILVESFVDSQLPKNFYDVAVGNPPFNNTAILADPEYKKLALPLHDYFFAKTMDRVKPGGLVVFVTSRYTMDKLNDKARSYLADRADLVGAIRLPQTAFKKNAGTDVVTDVLFLRKKVDGETFDQAQPWQKSIPVKINKSSFPINEYFHAHPEMVLGSHSDTGKMANSPEPQYTVKPLAGDIDTLFGKAILNLPENIYQADRGSDAEAAKVREIDFNPKAQKEGSFYISDAGVLMQREGGVGVRAEQHQKNAAVIKDFVGLRDALKQAHYDQLNDGDWEKSLAALQKSYKAFVKNNGQINQFTEFRRTEKVIDEDTGETLDDERTYRRYPLISKIQDDPDYSLVMALENVNDETGKITESPFLTERVLGKPERQDVKTPADALLSVLNDIGHVDIDAISERLDMGRQETIDALGSMIYEDPAAGWVMSDEYLSGNVKTKLAAAQEAVKSDRRFERNIEALLSVQPAPVPPSDITVSIGMNWIPAENYENFLREKTGVKASVLYNERTGQWAVTAHSGESSLAATQEWGTPRRSAADILLAALTGAPIRITETVKEAGGGTKTVFLADATEAANQKLAQMRVAFRDWIWQDGARSDKLVKLYNDTFNTIVPRKFDGRHLTLPGTSKRWKVFDHVKRGAWRIIQSGNTYLAHAVGSGKTFQMIISAMEQKRLGLIKKPMMVVPNHMLQQFAREWVDLYPAARLMVADEKNFHTENRRRFSARVSMSDLDGVIITHSAFKLLDLDPAFKQKMIEQELDYLRAAFEEAGGEEGKKSRDPKIKQIESKIEKLEQKLEAAMSGAGKDKNVRFDELGVDMVYVDEAHEFRKLGFTTQRQVKGIDSSGSDRAFDLFMKTRWLEEKHPGRSLVMASGTPVTNTLAELYSVQRFMAPKVLEERGLEEFDAWASMFGQEHTEIEADASGKYAPVTRFSKFVNVPELTQMFREFADVLTSDHLAALLGDKRPKVAGGSRNIVITPQTSAYSDFKKELAERLAESRAWKPTRDEPNNPDPVIRIIGDGRLASIDMRFIDPSLPSDPESKLNKMADEVIRVFNETSNAEYNDKEGKVEPNKGSTQIVFSDLGFGAGVAQNRGFNARAWFEKRLRDGGVPPGKLAFMPDHKKSTDKLKLFKDINAGRVRVVVGSSKNMGTGVNAQQRLIALHHLDTPWYPADLEQREGRIVRQGNKNPLVQLYAFSTKGSYDAVMWQMLASKQRFIDQALSGDSSVRSIDDLSESSQFQIATAMTADDERAIQLAGLRAETEKLQRLYRAHEEQRARMRQEFDWAGETIRLNEQRLPDAIKHAGKVIDLSGDQFKATADGSQFTTRKEWGESLLSAFKRYSDKMGESPVKVGEVSGFDIMAAGHVRDGNGYQSALFLNTPIQVTLAEAASADPVGVSLRATNALANLVRLPEQMRKVIDEATAKRAALEGRIEAPFPMAEMLSDKIKEAQDLETAMLADQNKLTGLEREQQLEDAWQAKTGAITPLFSRGNGSGMALRDVKAVVDRIGSGFKNLPNVHVLESPAALSTKDPSQKALRDFIRKAGAMDDVEGATHDGDIYLFASGLADEARVEHVLATHEITHYGLRGTLGKGLDVALQSVWTNNTNVRKAAAKLKDRLGLESNVAAVEEVLAEMKPAELAKLSGWRRVVKVMRDWLARIGAKNLAARLDGWMKAGLSDQEKADLFVADMVNSARDWVRIGKGSAYVSGTRLAEGERDPLLHYGEGRRVWKGFQTGDRVKTKAGTEGTLLLGEDQFIGYVVPDLIVDQSKTEPGAMRPAMKKNPDAGKISSRASGLFSVNPKEVEITTPVGPIQGSLFSRNISQSSAQRADDIINSPVTKWRPVDAIMRALTTTVRLDRLTMAAYNKVGQLLDRYTPEQVKAGIISDYGIPEAVIDRRTVTMGKMRVELRKSGALIDKLATLTRAESRLAYEWMNNSDPQAVKYFQDQLPEDSVKVMEEVRDMIDALSREAVELGQLDPESFKRNRFEYLRRSYVKHTTELTKAETASRKRAISILGDQYKGRGMTDAIDMAKFKNVAPEWWGRKLKDGQADKQLKGEKFIRLERRAPVGDGVMPLEQAAGPGDTNPQARGRLLEVAYWPAGEAMPAKYSAWDHAGTWEARDTKGNKVIVWRDFTKQERINMGEIDEARYAIAKTLHGMIHDVETGRYLEWLAQTYAKKDGEAIDGTIVDASERMRDTFSPGEWVQVPETKIPGTAVMKYGMLAGRYIPGPIWNDVRQSVGFRFKPLGETYAAILGAWKTSKTALSPAVHTNNVMANFVMADWHDVTSGHVLKALRIMLGANQRDGKGIIGRTGNVASRAGISDADAAREIINRFEDSGANMGSWVTSELQKAQLEPLLAALEKEVGTVGQTMTNQVGIMSALQLALKLRFPSAWDAFKPTMAGKALTTEARNLLDLYEAEDQIFRLAAWLKAKEEGASDLVAGKSARRSFLDYHINAPWVQAMRSTALPFISFTYRAVPMMIEIAAKKPHKLMKLALVLGALNALGYAMSGGDEDDERRLLPEEKAGRIWGLVPKLIRMPWNDKNGSPVFLDVRRFIPVGDVFDLGQTHSAIPILPMIVPGGPLAVLSELAANKSQFTGKDIVQETDTPMERTAKVADHIYKAFAPNILILPGTYAWSGVSDAAHGKTDSFGREQSVTQAALSSIGVKFGSYPKDVLQLNAQRAAQAKMMEIDRNINQLKREHQRNGIDDQEFREKTDAQIAKKIGIMDAFNKKMSGN